MTGKEEGEHVMQSCYTLWGNFLSKDLLQVLNSLTALYYIGFRDIERENYTN